MRANLIRRIHCFFVFAFLLVLITSCYDQGSVKLRFDGEFTAKNLISVQMNLPARAVNTEYSWFIAPTSDGEWAKLDGIWTNEIVLLASYSGSYLRCDVSYDIEGANKSNTVSVISEKPVEYRGNPNTDWFRDAGYGIMVHYLKEAIVPDGGSAEWNEAVNSFDVVKFAEQAHSANAGYVMFTLGQNSGYYCAPNAAFDKALGIKPADLCSDRDLPMDLISELKKYDIPMILYLPSNPPVNNPLVSEKFIYPYKKDSATSQFNQPILEDMIREWSLRYGEDVKGWWFDGLYSWNNIRSTRMDMSLKHNISTHTLAAKAGNKGSIVTYNYGFGNIQVNTPYCDYSSGEKRTIDEFPENRWVEDGVQWFLFTYLGEKWGGHGQQFETDSLVSMAERIVSSEGVLCLEVVTDPAGSILPHHLEQIQAVGKRLANR